MDRLAVSRAWADNHAAWLSSSQIEALGDELTIRHKSVRYSGRSTDTTAGALPLCDANGTEILTLNFASTDRWSLQLSAKLTTHETGTSLPSTRRGARRPEASALCSLPPLSRPAT